MHADVLVQIRMLTSFSLQRLAAKSMPSVGTRSNDQFCSWLIDERIHSAVSLPPAIERHKCSAHATERVLL